MVEYEATIYFTSFVKVYVEADNADEALAKAREQAPNEIDNQHIDFRANADPYEVCDEVTKC